MIVLRLTCTFDCAWKMLIQFQTLINIINGHSWPSINILWYNDESSLSVEYNITLLNCIFYYQIVMADCPGTHVAYASHVCSGATATGHLVGWAIAGLQPNSHCRINCQMIAIQFPDPSFHQEFTIFPASGEFIFKIFFQRQIFALAD